jgi:beta-N-acetylhexosaminidase
MAFGSLMLDLLGQEISNEEYELLKHPSVGGLIFFTRNYESSSQIIELIKSIRAIKPDILIAVDHEGGRVQRFRSEFTRLPPVATLGKLYAENAERALTCAKQHAWLMAAELRAVGIDFSFAPVLDLNFGDSPVIGDRAFHRQPEAVIALAGAYIAGMREAGMAATGKHFPGHGYVNVDSHLDIPRDERELDAIMQEDVLPFRALIQQGLDAVMPAHVIYEKVDSQPAGFSSFWLQKVLRQQLGFQGVIFSDDLNMEGARVAGSYASRAEAALAAGCDMALICNNRAGAIEILDKANLNTSAESSQRLQRMRGQAFMNRHALLADEYWQQTVDSITRLA